mmetsp:Transcript_16645/g.19257  ORF Transcript_16645/g.19257 Transcript_16645/m.19257 type:complete len:122 (+) Transcript_16645:317-682(+)
MPTMEGTGTLPMNSLEESVALYQNEYPGVKFGCVPLEELPSPGLVKTLCEFLTEEMSANSEFTVKIQELFEDPKNFFVKLLDAPLVQEMVGLVYSKYQETSSFDFLTQEYGSNMYLFFFNS